MRKDGKKKKRGVGRRTGTERKKGGVREGRCRCGGVAEKPQAA